jgi:hypothetical protein
MIHAMSAVGAVVVADAASNALGGCCSGLGLQRYAAFAQLGGYALGMTAGAGLAFGWRHGAEDGAFMLWAGLGLSMALAAAIQLGLLCRHGASAGGRPPCGQAFARCARAFSCAFRLRFLFSPLLSSSLLASPLLSSPLLFAPAPAANHDVGGSAPARRRLGPERCRGVRAAAKGPGGDGRRL